MLTNIELYFIHGWGFGATMWDKWSAMLSQHISINLFDRGYFKHTESQFNFKHSERLKIVIAHSLGLHYLASKDFDQIHLLVLMSGFTQFHKETNNLKFSLKQIELMKQKAVLDPNQLLTDFYTRCGLEGVIPFSPLINYQLLCDDLTLLDSHHLDLDKLKSIPQVLLLQGVKDNIVNKKHSITLHEQLPHSKLFLHQNAGHALPLTDPDWCTKIIQSQFNKKLFAGSFDYSQTQ